MEWERIIMLELGIAVLRAFFPFSVISFHRYRLPKKRREYQRIRRIRGKDGVAGEGELSDEGFGEEYKGTDYILPVFFVTLFCALGFWVFFARKKPVSIQ